MKKERREGLGLVRLLMVLGSLAPLFILMAVRGNSVIPNSYFTTICVLLAVLPTIFLSCRVRTAQRQNDIRSLIAGYTEDHRSHVLIYLFAILLPFYRDEIADCRDLAAMGIALGLIIFLFWRLNLHYMNLWFAFFRYNVFTVSPPQDDNPHTGAEKFVLITKRNQLQEGERFDAIRLSNSVYLEKQVCS